MKHRIRKEIRGKLGLQSKEERAEKSALVKEKLFRLEEFKKAECVMFYVSLPEEVDTSEMIGEALKAGKKVCVPITIEDSRSLVASEIDESSILEKGPCGTRQPKESDLRPVPLEDIDLVVVPGVAFDCCNVRLGRGHGYYDRFLKLLPKDTVTIGLAFDFQLVEGLPKDSHDVPVSKTIAA